MQELFLYVLRYMMLFIYISLYTNSYTHQAGIAHEVVKEVKFLMQNQIFLVDFEEMHKGNMKYKGTLLCDFVNKRMRISYDVDKKIIVLNTKRAAVLYENELSSVRSSDTPMELLLKLDRITIANPIELRPDQFRVNIFNRKYFLQLLYDRALKRITMIYFPANDCLIKLDNFVDIKKQSLKEQLFFISSDKSSVTRRYKDRVAILLRCRDEK
ncbi:MAG: hypothetical protein AAFO15_00725 [Pseudomonadota bacterium]